ncbi:U1 small nuclear ribonucleoprotein 70 kDa [Babesia sp. Xinjiang]|uniref:U1 small nuclear ribonucleoprotein 70 kDa n=1 Tax=Babesia sp. Xinjiang TaxID=462227 RepID=UPI000A232A12|nr:U1 small nuclear ribonucleoprotein 70 kDa [Babesia sp. Xinjiang]ORM41722.1 U1 small nuclear ribonucleoprotein 70 kDa [Babesia sp. Xinjiang]
MSALGMPPHLLVLFQARPPLDYIPPIQNGMKKKIDGIAAYLDSFSDEKVPPDPPFETPRQRADRKKRQKLIEFQRKQRLDREAYDPKFDPALARGSTNPWLTHDPYKTLFVCNIPYEMTEKQLWKEFDVYGRVRRIRMINDRTNRPRGYAFVEYSDERDMVNAYKRADGKKISGRRVMVDVERARTVEGWFPKRLGGGKGRSRTKPPKFYDEKPLIIDEPELEDSPVSDDDIPEEVEEGQVV